MMEQQCFLFVFGVACGEGHNYRSMDTKKRTESESKIASLVKRNGSGRMGSCNFFDSFGFPWFSSFGKC